MEGPRGEWKWKQKWWEVEGNRDVQRGMERNHPVTKKSTMQDTGGEKNVNGEAQGEKA